MEPTPPFKPNRVASLVESLQKKYVVIGRGRVSGWHAWLVIGLVVGIAMGVILVANRHGKIQKGKAKIATQFTQLSASQQTSGKTAFGMPFGSNNAYLSDVEETDVWLKDLGITWISDHLPRRDIEKPKGGYDFSRIDGLLQEYGAETKANAWFIINIESKLKFDDGKEIPDTNKFVPNGPSSYAAYEKFLEALVIYANTKVPGWKVKFWSIDNEHAALYLPAFCGPRDRDKNAMCAKKAAEAYANLVERSYRIIKRLDPQAKIVFGGPASGSPREDYDLYYKQALIALRAKDLSGYFDFFDYHNFNSFDDYQHNMEGLGIEYFRTLLSETGFKGKPIIIKAGGTHSGKDELSKNKRLHILQTESQQAEHEFKRLVYHVANGISLILRDTGKEDSDLHTTFSYHGLRYNGIPRSGACDPKKEQPCPDPGDGLKKLSYYTYKFLIEKLRGSDFGNVKTIETGIPNVYLYEFIKGGSPVYVAWWDYFKEPSVGATKRVTLTLPNFPASSAKVTDATPTFGADFQTPSQKLSESDYPSFFHSSTVSVTHNAFTLTLSKAPVYVEGGSAPFSESSCSPQKATRYVATVTAKARELGITPQGSNFLGCDQRNIANGQLQDILPSDLSLYDGVIFYNINGTNSVNTISLPAMKPAFMTAILQTGGGSNIRLTYQGSLQDDKKNGLWISIEGGGSNVSILSAPSGTSYSYTRISGGGSNVLLNGASISEGNGVVR